MSFWEEKKSYMITLIIGFVIAVIICLTRQIFAAEDVTQVLVILCDATSIPGILFLGIGILIAVSNEGIFNGIAFGLKTIGRSFSAKKGEKIREEDFYEYNERMKEKQHSCGHFVFSGVFYVIVSLIFLVIYML